MMLSALDHTATDALHNFHDALQRAQQGLQQEESRLAQIVQAVRVQQEDNEGKRRVIRSQQQQRIEGLRREIVRVRSLLERHKEEAEAQQRHVEVLRQPRHEAESQGRVHTTALQQLQRDYLARSTAVHTVLLHWWQPQNSIPNLQALVKQREEEVTTLQNAVLSLQQHQQRLSLECLEADEKKDPEDEESLRVPQGAKMDEEEQMEDDDSAMNLERQIKEVQQQREAFARQSTETLALRRVELERLKGELKRLCVEVEAADAAHQAAQQELHTVLNQHCDARVGCGVCGGDVVGSFMV